MLLSTKMSRSALLYRYRPVLWFHPDETFYPIRFEKYITFCNVYHKDTLLASSPTVSEFTTLLECFPHHELRLNPISFPTQHFYTVYSFIREIDSYYELVYIFFYAYNDFRRCLCINGNHNADLEHITLRIRKDNEQLEKMYFGAHGYKDGITLFASEIEMVEDRPMVYVALGSHAMYPSPQSYYRYFGCGNDYTARGTMILEYNLEHLSDHSLLIQYKGKLGEKTASLTTQTWYTQESWKNTTSQQRCFPMEQIRKRLSL